jgi:hypothetical protein
MTHSDMQATSGEERHLRGCAGLGGNGMMVAASCARRRKASFIVAATSKCLLAISKESQLASPPKRVDQGERGPNARSAWIANLLTP